MLTSEPFCWKRGLNGRGGFVDNLKHRSQRQAIALETLVGILKAHRAKIIQIVDNSRNRLKAGGDEQVAIRMGKFRGENPLQLPLIFYRTGKDTLLIVGHCYPIVEPNLTVKRPKGYLIRKADGLLTEFVLNHRIEFLETIADQTVDI